MAAARAVPQPVIHRGAPEWFLPTPVVATTPVTASVVAVFEDIQALAIVALPGPSEATQKLALVGAVDPAESTQKLAITGAVDPAESQKGLAATLLAPFEALAVTVTNISNTVVLVFEALKKLAVAGTADPAEANKVIATTALDPLEATKKLAIAGSPDPAEALQKIAAAGSADPTEATQKLAIAGSSDPAEAMQKLAVVGTADPAESTKKLAVAGSADPAEAKQALAATGSEPAEAAQALARSASDPAEANRALAATTGGQLEGLQRLAATLLAPFEALQLTFMAVSQTAQLAFEALKGIRSRSTFEEALAPDAILEETNLSGAVGVIQEDVYSDDASWLTAVDATQDTSVRISFGTPGAELAATQTVEALVRATGAGSPTVRLDVYEGGVLIQTGTPVAVTSLTGEIISDTFPLSLLANPSGADVEVRVVGTAG